MLCSLPFFCNDLSYVVNQKLAVCPAGSRSQECTASFDKIYSVDRRIPLRDGFRRKQLLAVGHRNSLVVQGSLGHELQWLHNVLVADKEKKKFPFICSIFSTRWCN